MAEESGVLRRIVWRDVFPGLMLFRCFRLSIGLPILFLATVGTLLMPLGPWLSRAALPDERRETVLSDVSGEGVPIATLPPAAMLSSRPENWLRFSWPPVGVIECYRKLTAPFLRLFDRNATWPQWLGAVGTAAWYLAVWSIFGGAITRIAVVHLGRRERVSLSQSGRYVLPKFGWYFLAPLFPVLGIALAAIPLLILGLLMHMSLGVFIAGLVWLIGLILGFIMAVLLTELVFGWPLMWPTISAEESSDAFQAFSNSFSYTFQRPLPYLGYGIVAVLIGGLGGIFVEAFAKGVVMLAYWGLSFGLGAERLNAMLVAPTSDSWLVGSGLRLMDIADRCVLTVAEAYYFSFFFCAASAIYLLLRREVDQTSFDEVYMPDDTGRYSLPTLRTGPHGVPVVEETPAEPLSDAPSE